MAEAGWDRVAIFAYSSAMRPCTICHVHAVDVAESRNSALSWVARPWHTVPVVDAPLNINLDRIDFISAYCDSWCERCAFTSRCSAYAVKVATAMCDGDFTAALELAVGAPPPEDAEEAERRAAFLEALVNEEPTEAELNAVARQEEAREERLDDSPITTAVARVGTLSSAWLESHPDDVVLASCPRLGDALAVAGWDCHLIGAKLHRALHGRDEFMQGEGFDDDPVQNDWNGSAKVALISIRRSVTAWTAIAEATGDPDAARVADELRRLGTEIDHTFPDAWKFIRPGFDQIP